MTKAEQYIKKSTRRSQEGDRPYNEWVSVDCAKEAVEIAKEDLIDKACEWLNNFYSEERHCYLVKEDIEAFIKAMEE